MPSMDIVSEMDLQELDNAINQTAKEIGQRFDFRGGKSSIALDKGQKKVKILADDDFKLRAIHQILGSKLAKRSLDLRGIDFSPEEPGSNNILKQEGSVRAGLSKEEAKKIIKLIKETGLKSTPQAQDDQVRVTSKSIDDLQAIMAHLRNSDLGLPLQFINMKRD